MSIGYDLPPRCGIILAAGEGQRLKPLIRHLRGDGLPKQYVNFIGRGSMLEHTIRRAERMIAPERLFTVVNENHFQYPEVWRQLSGRPKGTVILQPENKETGPGLFLPLMHLYKRYPEAVAVVFPSDHFILEEDLFMGHVELACREVEQDPFRVVLLGVEPDGPEPAYGYILPEPFEDPQQTSVVRKVTKFIEKPEFPLARELAREDGLWNTLVMAFKVRTFLDLLQRIVPDMHRAFQRIRLVIDSATERNVVRETYKTIMPLNFSNGLLQVISARYPSRLWVLPVRGVYWSDWGSERRIVSVLQRTGLAERLRYTNEKRPRRCGVRLGRGFK